MQTHVLNIAYNFSQTTQECLSCLINAMCIAMKIGSNRATQVELDSIPNWNGHDNRESSTSTLESIGID